MQTLPDTLLRHRSIRAFKPDPIHPALVEEVCAQAIAGGSSSGNLNTFSIVLTRDGARKRRLHELHFEQDMVLQAPLVMTFCADMHRTRSWLERRGARDNFGNLIGWDPWVEALKDHHRVLRFDLTAHGLTGPDPSGDYSLERTNRGEPLTEMPTHDGQRPQG